MSAGTVALLLCNVSYYHSGMDIKAGFTVVGAHFQLFCKRLQSIIIFIVDWSADHFLHLV